MKTESGHGGPMTSYRDHMLAVLRGKIPPGLLFVPRLDIWYNRNRLRGTLPPGLEELTLPQIAAWLEVPLHAVVPDFIRSVPLEDVCHRGLGFYNHPDYPCRIDFSSVDFEIKQFANALEVVYHGQHGTITTRTSYGHELFASGSSIPDLLDYAIKTREDYRSLAEILSRVTVRSTPEGYAHYRQRIGDAGLAVGYVSLACGPMHHIQRDLRRFEEFCLDLYDAPELVALCAEPLAAIYEAMLRCVQECSAELVLFGANYDETITFPPFFREHLAPWLNRATDLMNGHGKCLLTHTDGENKGLMPIMHDCRFDVADSVCPAPMTKVSLKEYRQLFEGRTTIWGGIPSILLLPSCCSESEFKAYVNDVIEDCRPYERLILSIADTTPPDADFGRILYLRDMCAATWDG